MTRLRLAERITMFLSILSLALWLLNIKTPDGAAVLFLTILGALACLLAIIVVVKNGLLSFTAWRWLLPLIVIGSTFIIYSVNANPSEVFFNLNLVLILAAGIFLLLFFVFVKSRRNQFRKESWTFFREFWIYLAFAPISMIWLKVVVLFTPQTIDEALKKIDTLIFSHYPDAWIKSLDISGLPLLWLSLFYFLLPFYPIALSGLFYIKKEFIWLRKVTQSFLLCGMIGWLFYLIFPAIGPLFLDIKVAGYFHPAIFRNCFPSLHTSWGLLVLIYAWKYRKKIFWILLLPVSQMILATVFLRFHYVIDLIAAVPYTFFIYWLNEKLMARELSGKLLPGDETRKKSKPEILVYAVFILSGLSALIYQVYFMKKISLIFGSTALAVTTVLAAFMFGLAAGSYIGGRIADRVKSPIRIYAYAELLVGMLLLVSPLLFKGMENLYVSIGKNAHLTPWSLTFIRILFSLPVILLPTLAMGTTLPLLTKYLTTVKNKIIGNVSRLYSANIIGAAMGTFLATYVLMPNFGMMATIAVAILINLVIALVVLRLGKHFPVLNVAGHDPLVPEAPEPSWHSLSARVMNTVLLVSALGLGLVSFAGEVVWTHLLAMIVGNSVYAFGVMLIAVLVGLAMGGYLAGRLVLNQLRKLQLVAALQFLIACFFLLQLLFWDKIPVYMQHLWITATRFPEREFVRFAISFTLLILPTLAVGLTFPLLVSLYATNLKTLGTRIGRISFVNTSGNILGTLVMGFLLLPRIGSFRASILIAMAAAANGLLLLSAWPGKRKAVLALSLLMFFIAAVAWLPGWNLTNLSLGTNVYFTRQHHGTVIDSWEEKDGGFTTITEERIPGQRKKKITLWTNGKFQGDNLPEMEAQFRFALYPIIFSRKYDRALVIGLGTGVSGRVVQEAGFKDIEVAEISPGIVAAAREYFSRENGFLLDQKNVRLRIEDGRNLLLLNRKPFDLITMEISSVWFAGAAALYSVEFYELAKKNLAADGIFQQWIQLHHISPYDVLVTIATVRSVFPHVRLFFGGSQGVIVASQEPLQIPFQKLLGMNRGRPSTFIANISPFQNVFCLLGEELLGEQGINRFLASYLKKFGSELTELTSNDNNMFLEYSTPQGNVRNYLETLRGNVMTLLPFHEQENDVVTAIPSAGWRFYVSGCVKLGQKQFQAAREDFQKAKNLLEPGAHDAIDRLLAEMKKSDYQKESLSANHFKHDE
ncbi:MAG: fused MFS/spermidine synthase [Candidatus Aminicenantes bacterium]|nr:fused MFS/spermidine synthase [Candidatus Aminicenantes bacterium]